MSCHSKEELENMLEDVINTLELSESMIEKHGPLGTSPAELVRLVLERKEFTDKLALQATRNELADTKRGLESAQIANASLVKKCLNIVSTYQSGLVSMDEIKRQIKTLAEFPPDAEWVTMADYMALGEELAAERAKGKRKRKRISSKLIHDLIASTIEANGNGKILTNTQLEIVMENHGYIIEGD